MKTLKNGMPLTDEEAAQIESPKGMFPNGGLAVLYYGAVTRGRLSWAIWRYAAEAESVRRSAVTVARFDASLGRLAFAFRAGGRLMKFDEMTATGETAKAA